MYVIVSYILKFICFCMVVVDSISKGIISQKIYTIVMQQFSHTLLETNFANFAKKWMPILF